MLLENEDGFGLFGVSIGEEEEEAKPEADRDI